MQGVWHAKHKRVHFYTGQPGYTIVSKSKMHKSSPTICLCFKFKLIIIDPRWSYLFNDHLEERQDAELSWGRVLQLLASSSGEGGNGLSWSLLYKSKYGNLSNAAKFVLHTKISFKFKLEVSLGGRIYRLLWIYTGCFFYCSALKCQPLKEISELFLPKND